MKKYIEIITNWWHRFGVCTAQLFLGRYVVSRFKWTTKKQINIHVDGCARNKEVKTQRHLATSFLRQNDQIPIQTYVSVKRLTTFTLFIPFWSAELWSSFFEMGAQIAQTKHLDLKKCKHTKKGTFENWCHYDDKSLGSVAFICITRYDAVHRIDKNDTTKARVTRNRVIRNH